MRRQARVIQISATKNSALKKCFSTPMWWHLQLFALNLTTPRQAFAQRFWQTATGPDLTAVGVARASKGRCVGQNEQHCEKQQQKHNTQRQYSESSGSQKRKITQILAGKLLWGSGKRLKLVEAHWRRYIGFFGKLSFLCVCMCNQLNLFH